MSTAESIKAKKFIFENNPICEAKMSTRIFERLIGLVDIFQKMEKNVNKCQQMSTRIFFCVDILKPLWWLHTAKMSTMSTKKV